MCAACGGGSSDDAADDGHDEHGHDEDGHDEDGHDEDEDEDAHDHDSYDEGDEPLGADFHESLDELRAGTPTPDVPAIERIACDLVTADEVAALGYQVTAGPVVNQNGTDDECVFAIINSYGSNAPVLVTVYDAGNATAFGPDVFESSQLVDNIGAEAWAVRDMRLAQARLDDGRVVSIQDVAAQSSREALVDLLAGAVARI
jgi:hypothetical protein